MRVKFYCDLYVSPEWRKKKEKLMRLVRRRRLRPSMYVVALAQGGQNELEFFSSILLKQHVFDNSEIFVVGIADGYEDALSIVEELTDKVYQMSGTAMLRRFVLERQEEFEKTRR